MDSELWISHLAIETWQKPAIWTDYLDSAQRILDTRLTHLDVVDPVRKKVASLADAGNYVCAFKVRENSRWLFGRFGTSGITFSVHHHLQLGQWPNDLTWHLPASFASTPENCERVKALHDLGNRTFLPFYAYCDQASQIASKKKPSGAIDIRAELLGVFWITYFNAAYVAFLSKEKINELPKVEYTESGGVTAILGNSPQTLPMYFRERCVAMLGMQTFVCVEDMFAKRPGQVALTFQQLRAFDTKIY